MIRKAICRGIYTELKEWVSSDRYYRDNVVFVLCVSHEYTITLYIKSDCFEIWLNSEAICVNGWGMEPAEFEYADPDSIDNLLDFMRQRIRDKMNGSEYCNKRGL